MKKITQKDKSKLALRRGGTSTLRSAIERMEKSEILMIGKDECGDSNGPARICKRVSTGTGKKFEINFLADGTGWVVERVE